MLRATVRRYRALRAVVRAISVAAGPRRRTAAEALLHAAFGDTVEAQGHLLRITRGDRPLGERLRRRGIWSEAETALYRRLLRPGQTAVDGGAHVGYFTTLFARQVGVDGLVIAFEPEPQNRSLLEENVRANGYANVKVVGRALAAEAGQQPLSLAAENLGDHRLGRELPARETITVSTTTLDAELDAIGRRPALIKLDVQGAEAAVLAGGRRTLAASPDLTLVTEFCTAALDEAGANPEAFLEQVVAAGFEIAVLEPGGRLAPLATGEDRGRLARDPETDVNLVCSR